MSHGRKKPITATLRSIMCLLMLGAISIAGADPGLDRKRLPHHSSEQVIA
jgi:hypothetical protein